MEGYRPGGGNQNQNGYFQSAFDNLDQSHRQFAEHTVNSKLWDYDSSNRGKGQRSFYDEMQYRFSAEERRISMEIKNEMNKYKGHSQGAYDWASKHERTDSKGNKYNIWEEAYNRQASQFPGISKEQARQNADKETMIQMEKYYKSIEKNSKEQLGVLRESLNVEKEQAKLLVEDSGNGFFGRLEIKKEIRRRRKDGDKAGATILEDEYNEQRRKSRSKDSEGNDFKIVDTILKSFANTVFSKDGIHAEHTFEKSLASATPNIVKSLLGENLRSIGPVAGAIAGLVSDASYRSAEERMKLESSINRYTSTTGKNVSSINNLDYAGYTYGETMGYQTQMALTSGKTRFSQQNAENALLLQRGYGVNAEANLGLRQQSDILKIVNQIYGAGKDTFFKDGDRTLLNEFIQKSTSFQSALLQTSSNVSAGKAASILAEFGNIGGQFSMADPRGMSNIMSIHGSLASPNNDSKKALAYSVLSRMNPRMGIFDLQQAMEGGLNTPGYLRSVISQLDNFGGDDQTQMMNLRDFTGLSSSAARELYNKRGSIGNMSDRQIKDIISNSELEKNARESTTMSEKSGAEIRNAFVQGGTEGMIQIGLSMAEAFSEKLNHMFTNAEIKMQNGTVKFNNAKPKISTNSKGIGEHIKEFILDKTNPFK